MGERAAEEAGGACAGRLMGRPLRVRRGARWAVRNARRAPRVVAGEHTGEGDDPPSLARRTGSGRGESSSGELRRGEGEVVRGVRPWARRDLRLPAAKARASQVAGFQGSASLRAGLLGADAPSCRCDNSSAFPPEATRRLGIVRGLAPTVRLESGLAPRLGSVVTPASASDRGVL